MWELILYKSIWECVGGFEDIHCRVYNESRLIEKHAPISQKSNREW